MKRKLFEQDRWSGIENKPHIGTLFSGCGQKKIKSKAEPKKVLLEVSEITRKGLTTIEETIQIGPESNYDNTQKKKEVKKWENSETGKDVLGVPNLFDSVITQIENQTPVCSKCSNQIFQFWEINERSATLRCVACKKKMQTTSVDDNLFDVVNLYINYVQSAYSHENEFMREKLINTLKYDFLALRKNTPLIRAIEFRANGKSVTIEDVKTDDKDSRRISQTVKDKVWNRDGGKCVECGSNKFLEFDHIIPHSKGGANSYRNIQLLCEACNRSKSDKIG